MCSVIIAESGKIYHQAVLDQPTCNDQNFVNTIGRNIARQFRDPNAQIKCCSTDGCNWSWATAANNQALGESSTASDDSVLLSYVGVAVGIFVIILIGLLCCFIYYWRKNREEEEEEYLKKQNENIVQDRFYGRNRSDYFNYSNFDNNYDSTRSSSASGDRRTVESSRSITPASRSRR